MKPIKKQLSDSEKFVEELDRKEHEEIIGFLIKTSEHNRKVGIKNSKLKGKELIKTYVDDLFY